MGLGFCTSGWISMLRSGYTGVGEMPGTLNPEKGVEFWLLRGDERFRSRFRIHRVEFRCSRSRV